MILFNEPRFEANNKRRAREALLSSVQWKCSAWTNAQQCCENSLRWYPARANSFPRKATIYNFTMCCRRKSYLLKKHCFYVCGTTRPSLSKNILNRKAGTGRPVHTSAPWSALLCLWQLPVYGSAQEPPVLEEVTVCKRGCFCITYKTLNAERFELSSANAWKLQQFTVEESIARLMNQAHRLCSEKQGQNYQVKKLCSIKTFNIKNIHIHAKMTPHHPLSQRRPILFIF